MRRSSGERVRKGKGDSWDGGDDMDGWKEGVGSRRYFSISVESKTLGSR